MPHKRPFKKPLLILLLVYGVASLIHFIHNAEYLAAYPNLPESWTRSGVYLAWVGMTCVGVLGCFLLYRGYQAAGLITIAVYALLGIDSIAHYIVAPMSAHTAAMHVTILLEVTAGGLLLIETVRLFTKQIASKRVRH
ncbi:MAG: hypothetical protein KTR29_20455 [Rhodothermaceae bacterium]|nr:hypothetical protein [Rhodothermaceae bacterium]